MRWHHIKTGLKCYLFLYFTSYVSSILCFVPSLPCFLSILPSCCCRDGIFYPRNMLANDPQACNRIVIYRPSKNIISQNELISLWEQKTALPPPQDIPISIIHSAFVRGDHIFDLKDDDLEASQLYPDYNYKSIDQLLDKFLVDPPPPASAAFG
ncbi:unnamed protein product [Trifolium pratense]|uniref:Uncharacterized protein n=1 Tax=Trifolium pratense TaxID=57577 RepID=A0ACB0JX93_TRIPR|nr:unnamed protein product [Trifolium pratense]